MGEQVQGKTVLNLIDEGRFAEAFPLALDALESDVRRDFAINENRKSWIDSFNNLSTPIIAIGSSLGMYEQDTLTTISELTIEIKNRANARKGDATSAEQTDLIALVKKIKNEN